jgi:hypothetical protein
MSFKVKAVRPLFTGVITTANKFVGDQATSKGSLIVDTRKMDGTLNYYQTVVSVGSTVRDLKKDDIVKINFSRYAKPKHTPGAIDEAANKQFDNLSWDYEIPIIIIDDIEYLFIQDRDIEYVVTDYELDGSLLQ